MPASAGIQQRPGSLLLFFQQKFFAPDAPAVAAYFTIPGKHTVTGDENGDPVCPAGPGHGPDGGWSAYLTGNLALVRGFSRFNAAQRRPDHLLKGGA